MFHLLATLPGAPGADAFVCHFHEAHQIPVRAEGGQVLAAVAAMSGREDAVIRALIAMREWPGRMRQRLGLGRGRVGAPFGLADFVPLGGDGHSWCAFGLAGRFWQADYGLVALDSAEAFYRHAQPGVAKLVLLFHVRQTGAGQVMLTTETGIHCPDPQARRWMTAYWWLIRPASGWIRQRMLRQIRRQAERGAAG